MERQKANQGIQLLGTPLTKLVIKQLGLLPEDHLLHSFKIDPRMGTACHCTLIKADYQGNWIAIASWLTHILDSCLQLEQISSLIEQE